jgi:hypothetical protein
MRSKKIEDVRKDVLEKTRQVQHAAVVSMATHEDVIAVREYLDFLKASAQHVAALQMILRG